MIIDISLIVRSSISSLLFVELFVMYCLIEVIWASKLTFSKFFPSLTYF